MFASQFTVNLTPNPLPKSTTDLLDLGLTFIPTIQLLDYEDTIESQRYITRRCSLYDYFQFHSSSNNLEPDDFRRQFTGKSNWTPSTRQLSNDTLKMINKMLESTSNLTAGKIYHTNDKQLIKHKCKPNLTAQQLKEFQIIRTRHLKNATVPTLQTTRLETTSGTNSSSWTASLSDPRTTRVIEATTTNNQQTRLLHV